MIVWGPARGDLPRAGVLQLRIRTVLAIPDRRLAPSDLHLFDADDDVSDGRQILGVELFDIAEHVVEERLSCVFSEELTAMLRAGGLFRPGKHHPVLAVAVFDRVLNRRRCRWWAGSLAGRQGHRIIVAATRTDQKRSEQECMVKGRRVSKRDVRAPLPESPTVASPHGLRPLSRN